MRGYVLLLPLALSACAGFTYAMTNYDKVEPVVFPYTEAGTGDDYRVFDRPAAGKLMITPSVRQAAHIGLERGLTLGLAGNGDVVVPIYRNAASAYLASTGRTCDITFFDRIAEPQYEATYVCHSPKK